MRIVSPIETSLHSGLMIVQTCRDTGPLKCFRTCKLNWKTFKHCFCAIILNILLKKSKNKVINLCPTFLQLQKYFEPYKKFEPAQKFFDSGQKARFSCEKSILTLTKIILVMAKNCFGPVEGHGLNSEPKMTFNFKRVFPLNQADRALLSSYIYGRTH